MNEAWLGMVGLRMMITCIDGMTLNDDGIQIIDHTFVK